LQQQTGYVMGEDGGGGAWFKPSQYRPTACMVVQNSSYRTGFWTQLLAPT
jgi:hypothetical protein